MADIKYREEWLQRAVKALRPIVRAAGLTVPPTVHASIGWPSKGALSIKRRRLGECWYGAASKDGNPQVFISPGIGDSVEVLATLLHEMLHTTFDPKVGHGPAFAKACREVGLEGKPTATVAGEELKEKLVGVVEWLGVIPHSGISAMSKRKVQGTRLLKVGCGCGYMVRVTQKWVDVGMPVCPCGEEMELAQ